MGRFGPTSDIEDPDVQHSVITLLWGTLLGADGPSDGSAGAGSNVPSALSVLRHAPLYAQLPAEIEEAFQVLERHAIRTRQLYPVAVTIVPFLFDIVRRGSLLAARITTLIAEYAAASGSLEPSLRERLFEVIEDHAPLIVSWIGTHDVGAAALAIHVPAIRDAYLAALAATPENITPIALLALIDLGAASEAAIATATALLDAGDAPRPARMAAAAFLARYGDRTPGQRTLINAALPPGAPAELAKLVGKLWTPTVDRPVVAPKLHDAEVVFAGAMLVLVRTGSRTVTLPWASAPVQRGDKIQVGITVHGEPRLVVVTQPDGSVQLIDF